MTLLQAIVIGIVQGLTEFLPVSSTAHMKIVPVLLGWKDPGSAFSAVIQMGTLAAVVIYFWRDLWQIAWAVLDDLRNGKFASSTNSRIGWMIVVGTIPIVVLGLRYEKQIDSTLRSMYVISATLSGVAALLAIAEWTIRHHRSAGRTLDKLNWRDAIVIGLAQATALVPGVSRSGATLLGGLASGLNRETAARYSFLLSVPSIFGAGMYKLLKESKELLGDSGQVMNLIAGTLAAGIVGYLAIDWLLKFFRKRSTAVFIVYRIALAAAIVVMLRTGWIVDNVPTAPTAAHADHHSRAE